MGRVIVITSGKGGVGKSTLTTNIGVALAKDGFNVCLIDADLGLRNLDVILGLEKRIIYDMEDVINQNCKLEKALVRDRYNPNLSILPACKSLDVQKIDFSYIQEIINNLTSLFDYILIDCPAGIERGFSNAIHGANEALVVITLDISSIRDADKVIGLLHSKGISDVKLIINKVNPYQIASNVSLTIEDALEILALPLIGVVYDDEAITMGNNNGIPVANNDKNYISRCFFNISKRIQGENIDLLKFRKKGFLARILG